MPPSETRIQLARALKGLVERQGPQTVMRRGEVTDVNPDGTVNATIGGDDQPVESVPVDNNYVPRVGDQVNVAITDGVPQIPGMDGAIPSALRAVALASASVVTSEARGNTAYGALATAGPSVTIDVGESGILIVGVTASISTTSTNDGGAMTYALSGANTLAAGDSRALAFYPKINGALVQCSRVAGLGGLTPGSTVVTAQYRDLLDAGTDVFFANRYLWALSF